MNAPVSADPMRQPGPYLIVDDDTGHNYVIPKAQLSHWNKWIHSAEWEDGAVPGYVDAIGGAISLVSFPEYTCE